MRSLRLGCACALVCLVELWHAAQAQTPVISNDVRAACAADARRLCADVLSDETKRRQCMHDRRAELSDGCILAIAKSRQ